MANEFNYGFLTETDRNTDLVTDVGESSVIEMVERSLEIYNSYEQAMLGAWIETTTDRSQKVLLPKSMIAQPLSADDNPLPVRATGSYDQGYPIWWWGTGHGMNREEFAKWTLEMVRRQTIEQLKGLARRKMREALKACIYDVGTSGWTFVDRRGHSTDPDVTVRSLADGDSIQYLFRNGSTGTDNHYLGHDGTLSDASEPFRTIWNELYEHPSNNLDQTNAIITFVSTTEATNIENNLTALKALTDDYIIPGISSDRADNAGILAAVPFGERAVGIIKRNIIVEYSEMPTGIMLSMAPLAAPSPLRQRVESVASLVGAHPEIANPDGNHREYRVLERFGRAVHNRVAMVATHIGAGTYTNPTGFEPYEQE